MQVSAGGIRPLAELDASVARSLWEGCQREYGLKAVAALATAPVVTAEQPFSGSGQDLIEQLQFGLGWRVTAAHRGSRTESLLVTSPDPNGVRFVITAPRADAEGEVEVGEETLDHFANQHIERFLSVHDSKPGVAVLAFETTKCGGLETVHAAYMAKHPALLLGDGPLIYEQTDGGGRRRVLEVFAYYEGKGVARCVINCPATME